jgi:hypothetical protein
MAIGLIHITENENQKDTYVIMTDHNNKIIEYPNHNAGLEFIMKVIPEAKNQSIVFTPYPLKDNENYVTN